jgi:hypothetical protein
MWRGRNELCVVGRSCMCVRGGGICIVLDLYREIIPSTTAGYVSRLTGVLLCVCMWRGVAQCVGTGHTCAACTQGTGTILLCVCLGGGGRGKRCAVGGGICTILNLYWEIIPSATTAGYVSRLTGVYICVLTTPSVVCWKCPGGGRDCLIVRLSALDASSFLGTLEQTGNRTHCTNCCIGGHQSAFAAGQYCCGITGLAVGA